MRRTFLLVLLVSYAAAQSRGPETTARYAAPAKPEWNLPVEPFRVAGNIYYVGAEKVSAYLITTSGGHILIETGFRETVPFIEANVKKLGFRFDDIRLLLASHAHYDHAGGLAAVKAATGARFLSSPREKDAFLRGGADDFAFGDTYRFPPVQPDALLDDGQAIRLGGLTVTAYYTPGHTNGCTSFTTDVRERDRTYHVIFPCSLTAPGYRLLDNPAYPDIVQDFERTFAKLRELPCDIFLPHHRSAAAMLEKSRTGTTEGNPFVDPAGYRSYLDQAEATLRKQIEEQRAAR